MTTSGTSRRPQAPLPADIAHRGIQCVGIDLDQLYTRDGEWLDAAARRIKSTARELCLPCPVREACRRAGFDGDEHGLWGGVLHLRPNNKESHKHVDLLAGVR